MIETTASLLHLVAPKEAFVGLSIEHQGRLTAVNDLFHEAGGEQYFGIRFSDRSARRPFVATVILAEVDCGILGAEVFEVQMDVVLFAADTATLTYFDRHRTADHIA